MPLWQMAPRLNLESMPSVQDELTPRIQAALAAAFGPDLATADPVLRPSQFADLQCNAPLALAKRLGMPPREVAAKVVAALVVEDVCDTVEVSGPGFINLTLASAWVSQAVVEMARDDRLGVPEQPEQAVPIDYSAPNVAKEMHVGHLRTTVVGDSLARTLESLGHEVIRQNHIGDWGTNFGMLIEHLMEVGEHSPEAGLLSTDPNSFYQNARVKFDDPTTDFAARARARVVALQAGDAETLRLWDDLVAQSKLYFNAVYSMLGVTLTDDDLAGESTYNSELAGICDELAAKGIAVLSDGALCVFLDEFLGREGKPTPLIIRKSDGGYGYGTTDLATIKYRVEDLNADRILYVVGSTQAVHLQMVFATAAKAGWLPATVKPVHVQIGSVLGPDKKILKTREGNPVRLMALLQEGIDRAQAYVDQARPDLSDAERATIARQVGIGAIKYADLSVAHDTEYVFDFDRMLALTGNTGPYLQYAAARVRNIFRVVATDPADDHWLDVPVSVDHPAERALALALLDLGRVTAQVGELLEPHRLCTYLFDVAQAFSAFYEHCPVLKADTEALRESRLSLSALTLRVLVYGLDLLGLEAPDQM